jgi:hypothetical protein
MSDNKLEMGSLDETQLEALREQLKAAVGGSVGTRPVPDAQATHSSHGDTDGWV